MRDHACPERGELHAVSVVALNVIKFILEVSEILIVSGVFGLCPVHAVVVGVGAYSLGADAAEHQNSHSRRLIFLGREEIEYKRIEHDKQQADNNSCFIDVL